MVSLWKAALLEEAWLITTKQFSKQSKPIEEADLIVVREEPHSFVREYWCGLAGRDMLGQAGSQSLVWNQINTS